MVVCYGYGTGIMFDKNRTSIFRQIHLHKKNLTQKF